MDNYKDRIYQDEPYLIIGCGLTPCSFEKVNEVKNLLVKERKGVTQEIGIGLSTNPMDGLNHDVGYHLCRVGFEWVKQDQQLVKKNSGILNPTALINRDTGKVFSSDQFPMLGFGIPADRTYTVDMEQKQQPSINASFRHPRVVDQYRRMAGKLDLIYFENTGKFSTLFSAEVNSTTVDAKEVMKVLLAALKPKGVMVVRVAGFYEDGKLVWDTINEFEGLLADSKSQIKAFNNQEEMKPYLLGLDQYGYLLDIRVVKL
jgi:hypothetical protein